jgi:hypothetical protein
MHIEKMKGLADALIESGTLTKSTSPITMSLNVLGYSTSEVFKRTTALPVTENYSPVEESAELSEFCQELNRGLAQKVAAEELLISTPYHLLKHGDIERLLGTARKYNEALNKLAFMSRKDIYETICTKDTNIARAVSRLVSSGKMIELKIGSVTEPLYPTFQLDENVTVYPTVPLVLEALEKNGMSILDFCLWIADEEGFIESVKKVSRKYYKSPFRVFTNIDDTTKMLDVLFEDKGGNL